MGVHWGYIQGIMGGGSADVCLAHRHSCGCISHGALCPLDPSLLRGTWHLEHTMCSHLPHLHPHFSPRDWGFNGLAPHQASTSEPPAPASLSRQLVSHYRYGSS